MVVLVGYASAHGSTREIAERIGVRLRERGLANHVQDLEQEAVEEPERYEALVLGSAVHDRAWLAPAKDFLRHHSELLATRPVWLFSVGMPGALRGPWKRLAAKEGPLILADLPGPPQYRSHRLLSGVVSRDQFPLRGRLLFRLMGCRYGDFRDWAAIDSWADGIARDVTAAFVERRRASAHSGKSGPIGPWEGPDRTLPTSRHPHQSDGNRDDSRLTTN